MRQPGSYSTALEAAARLDPSNCTAIQEEADVGGPLRIFNSTIAYEDNRADHVTSEPTIDATATAILLFAAL